MTEVFSIIAAICSLSALIIGFLVLKNQKNGGTYHQNPNETNLQQILERNSYITEQNSRDMHNYFDFMAKQQGDNLGGMAANLNALNKTTEQRLTEMQRMLTQEIKYMTEQNARNLEQIRQTVDEKLSSTLENRLNKSYSLINERLEAVYKGIGEVQQLAGSVADIKKVFSNVKLRGTWGEVQLSSLLEQMLSPQQYRANVHVDPTDSAVVEFAVLLPSKDGSTILLPIDSKFPVEEYRRLLDAEDSLDKAAAEQATKKLERALKLQAETIAKKYIRPPMTADFAIMFLPLEGLYAESLKMPGLTEFFNTHRIMACGPANLGALLTTLQMGYKTAAIERRSGELWELLSAFRHEFKNFVQLLEKVQKKLQEAQDTVESATRKTRTIDRKLKNVAEISDERADSLLADSSDADTDFPE